MTNQTERIEAEGGFRTNSDKSAGKELGDLFDACKDSTEIKMETFPKYVKRQKLTRLFALYELYKNILTIKGSVIDCGVFRGYSLMSFAHMSAILEPNNFMRRIYGFDTFAGFPELSHNDQGRLAGNIKAGDLGSDSFKELTSIIHNYDSTRFLGHMNKVELVKGEAKDTIPSFIKNNPHLLVSLLFLDFDLFEPTKVAIEHFYPRMPKGSIIAFDELDHPLWPGETVALLETIGINSLKIERLDFEPYISFAIL